MAAHANWWNAKAAAAGHEVGPTITDGAGNVYSLSKDPHGEAALHLIGRVVPKQVVHMGGDGSLYLQDPDTGAFNPVTPPRPQPQPQQVAGRDVPFPPAVEQQRTRMAGAAAQARQDAKPQQDSTPPRAPQAVFAGIAQRKDAALQRLQQDIQRRQEEGTPMTQNELLSTQQGIQDAFEEQIKAAGGSVTHYDYRNPNPAPAPAQSGRGSKKSDPLGIR